MTANENPVDCPKCGQPHGRCKGHNRAGGPCGKYPVKGHKVCLNHGAGSPQAIAKAERELEAVAAQELLAKTLAEAYSDGVPHIDPADAMLQAVSWKHAEVVALRAAVAALDLNGRTYGRIRHKTGGEDYGTTYEARPHIYWTMLRASEDQLVKFAAAARAAGCDEARVRLAEDQGRMVAVTIQGFATDLLTWIESVLTAEHPAALELLASAWSAKVREYALARLRAIAVSAESEAA